MLRIIRNFYYSILNFKLFLYFAFVIFNLFSFLLSRIIKSKPNLVIFGGMNGIYYADNSKFVFEHFLKTAKDHECCWLTNNISIFKDLRSKGLPVELSWSLKGVVKLYQAEIGVYSNTLRDISFEPLFVPSNLKLVALRHGKSVKRVLHGIRDFEKKEKPYRVATIKKEYRQIVFTISSSKLVSKMTEECMQIGLEKHLVTGYPRYDDFLMSEINVAKPTTEDIKEYKHLILYAPTWRNGINQTNFFPFENFNLDDLTSLLLKHDAVIGLRPHANDLVIFKSLKKYLNEIEKKSRGRIFLASHNKYPNTYDILKKSSVLISDYSSIYHDYLLLNKPMFFIPYDYQWFSDHFGFLYDYFDKIPGGIIKDHNSLISSLKQYFEGIDNFVIQRNRLRDEIHEYKDSLSSERVVKEILNLISHK
jgi:CDP-glycerol glycerophosphotransferase (TagB/SpsB family)